MSSRWRKRLTKEIKTSLNGDARDGHIFAPNNLRERLLAVLHSTGLQNVCFSLLVGLTTMYTLLAKCNHN